MKHLFATLAIGMIAGSVGCGQSGYSPACHGICTDCADCNIIAGAKPYLLATGVNVVSGGPSPCESGYFHPPFEDNVCMPFKQAKPKPRVRRKGYTLQKDGRCIGVFPSSLDNPCVNHDPEDDEGCEYKSIGLEEGVFKVGIPFDKDGKNLFLKTVKVPYDIQYCDDVSGKDAECVMRKGQSFISCKMGEHFESDYSKPGIASFGCIKNKK